MTIKDSGPLGISEIVAEIQPRPPDFAPVPPGFSNSLSFLHGLVKPAQRAATPRISEFYGKRYYGRLMDGNCNNGNCDDTRACGNMNCAECYITGPVDCLNCDQQKWLQTVCNVEPLVLYNCATAQHPINCREPEGGCPWLDILVPILVLTAVWYFSGGIGGGAGSGVGSGSVCQCINA
jgi:hypothetical protein